MSARAAAAAAVREPPIVLRSVMVDEGAVDLDLTFELTADGTHCALSIAGRAVADVSTLAGNRGVSIGLAQPATLYALRDLLGVLVTEAEAAGLLAPAPAVPEADA